MQKDKNRDTEALKQLIREGENGITLERAVEILAPDVDTERAIERERRAFARRVLRHSEFIPFKTDGVFTYKRLEMLGMENLADIQVRRIKPARTMINNAVRIAIAISRQRSLFNDGDANAILTLEIMQSEFERAAREIAREIERVKGETIIETKLEPVTPELEAAR